MQTDGIAQDSQRMFHVFLGNTLEENKVLFLMKVPQWCDFNWLLDAATQMFVCDKKLPSLELKTWFLAWKNVKTFTHSQQQPQGPKTHKKKSTIRLKLRINVLCPQGPFFTGSWSCLKSSARHTLNNRTVDNNQLKCCFDQQSQMRLVNLTGNDAKHTFKTPC